MLLPAIALTLVLGLGLLQLGSIQVRLTDAAADAARLIGRGQDASSRVSSAQLGATMAVSHDGPLVCVTVSAAVSATGAGSAVVLTGTGCALDDSQAPPS